METKTEEYTVDQRFIKAAETNDVGTLLSLIDQGIDINRTEIQRRNALLVATVNGHEEAVRALLDAGADPIKFSGDPILAYAARYGLINIVKLLLETHQDKEIERAQRNKNTALHWALERSHLDVASVLLDGGADMEAKCGFQKVSALELAVDAGNYVTVTFLLEKGAKVDLTRGENYFGILARAALNSYNQSCDGKDKDSVFTIYNQIIELLIKHGADKEARFKSGDTVLQRLAEYGNYGGVKILLDAHVSIPDDEGYTALRLASKSGSLATMACIVEKVGVQRFKDKILNDNWDSPLIIALRSNNVDAVGLLLGACLNNGELFTTGYPVLAIAAQGNNVRVLRLLLDFGVDKNQTMSNFYCNIDFYSLEGVRPGCYHHNVTALHIAAFHGNAEAVEFLLEAGVNKDAQDNFQLTALMFAAQGGHVKVMQLLLDKGVALQVKSLSYPSTGYSENETALTLATRAGCFEGIEMLLNMGLLDNDAKALNIAVSNGRLDILNLLLANQDSHIGFQDALSSAILKGHIEAVKLLLNAGADKNGYDLWGETPLHRAVCRNRLDIIELLLKLGADKTRINEEGERPLDNALEKGYTEAVNLLEYYGSPQYRLDKINSARSFEGEDKDLYDSLCDPNTLEIINDPIAVSSGITYDRKSLQKWFEANGNPDTVSCPQSRLPLSIRELDNKTHVLTMQTINRFVTKQEALAKSRLQSADLSVSDVGMFAQSRPADSTQSFNLRPK